MKMAEKVTGSLEVNGLGRNFEFGMIYDCRSDRIISDHHRWSQEVKLSNLIVSHTNWSNISVFPCDALNSKFNALNIGPLSKLCILTGEIPVYGSAEYLLDETYSDRIIIHYEIVSKVELVPSSMLEEQVAESLKNQEGTHVVTGITYGAHAFFVFHRPNCHQYDSLMKLVNLLQIKHSKEEFIGTLTKSQRKLAETTHVSFYGDVLPNVIPTSFMEAVEVFYNLPNIIGLKGENAVQTKMLLDPLPSSTVTQYGAQITDTSLIESVDNFIENLFKIETMCYDLTDLAKTSKFKLLGQQVYAFSEIVEKYKSDFLNQVKLILTEIQNGQAEETTLNDYLERYEKSPFNQKYLVQWLKQRQTEFNVLDKKLYCSEQVRFVNNSDQLKTICSDPQNELCLCFTIEIAENDIFMENMKLFLEKSTTLSPPDEYTQLLSDNKLDIKLLVENCKTFTDLVSAKVVNVFIHEAYVTNLVPSTYVAVYKKGEMLEKNYILPSIPERPSITEVGHDRITVTWVKATESVVKYIVSCKNIGPKRNDNLETLYPVDADNERLTLEGLEPGKPFQFKVRVVTILGPGPFSKTSKVIVTLPTSPPEKPEIKRKSDFTASVKWSRPTVVGKNVSIASYSVRYRKGCDNNWGEMKKVYGSNIETEVKIKPNTPYIFSIVANCYGTGKSLPGLESEKFQIIMKNEDLVKAKFKDESKLLTSGIKGYPAIYLLPYIQEYSSMAGNIRKCNVGHPNKKGAQEKVIMLVGATGSGKTTLINGMVNYILNVEWEDDFRFKLIDEEPKASYANQARSQTSCITSYTIYHQEGFKVPYSLTIVNTPGFGETEGIMRDKEINEQIRNFFESTGNAGIDHIDAVGFVVHSSPARLTPTQRYMFDSIQALFGKNIGDNIFMLLTFADARRPPVIDGLMAAKVPFKKIFKFNNSALYAANRDTFRYPRGTAGPGINSVDSDDQDGGKDFDRMFWELGSKSFKSFLNGHLSKVETKTSVLTEDVLNERHQLEVSVQGIQDDIQAGLNKLDQLQREAELLQAHKADIEKNKDFNYYVMEETVELETIASGTYTTNCLTCKRTCHYPCRIKDDGDKSGCWAMDDGICRICPRECIWNMHKNFPHKYTVKRERVKKTASGLKARYEIACKEKLSAEQLIEKVGEEFEAIQLKVITLTERVRKSLGRLQEIALKPNPLSTTEYIDLMIQSEKDEARPGWQDRVNQLKHVRKEAVYMKQMAGRGFDPFEKYKVKIKNDKKRVEFGHRSKISSTRQNGKLLEHGLSKPANWTKFIKIQEIDDQV